VSEGTPVAKVVKTDHGFEAWCLECDRLLVVGPHFDAVAEWTRRHRRLVHGDTPEHVHERRVDDTVVDLEPDEYMHALARALASLVLGSMPEPEVEGVGLDAWKIVTAAFASGFADVAEPFADTAAQAERFAERSLVDPSGRGILIVIDDEEGHGLIGLAHGVPFGLVLEAHL
jgi:hypothetical protein